MLWRFSVVWHILITKNILRPQVMILKFAE